MLRTTPAALLAFALSTAVLGQAPGSNDATFSPLDHGNAVGDPSPPNSEGSTFSVVLTCMATDASGRTIWGGKQYGTMGWSIHIERRNGDGSADPSFIGLDHSGYGDVNAVAAQSDGKILVGGTFYVSSSTYQTNLIRLNADGSLDQGFYDNNDWGTGSPVVRAIAVLPDGKILIGGEFTEYGGELAWNLWRLNSDGTRDPFWPTGNYGGTDGPVHSIRVQPDGRFLVGGNFFFAGGLARQRIARFDPGGIAPAYGDNTFQPGTGCNALVRCITLQADGRILVGGDLTTVNGTPRERIARLGTGGVLDGAFVTSLGFNGTVRSISVRPDGSVLAGGDFTSFAGTTRNKLAVLSTTGQLVGSFDPGAGPNGALYAARALPNGKSVAVGAFTTWSGVLAQHHIRVTASGGIDSTFCFNGSDGKTTAVAAYPDGRVLVAGEFRKINGVTALKVARLLPNGAVDPGFVAGVGSQSFFEATAFRANELLLQPDGRILVAGMLTSSADPFGGVGFGLARMQQNGALDASFQVPLPGGQEVLAMSLQGDGRIVAANNHFNARNTPWAYPATLARYNTDGSLDPGFASGATLAHLIWSTAVLPDGKVLVVGDLLNYAGSGRNHILRLNGDGSIDDTFNYVTGFAGGTPVHLLTYADGRCILSGSFTSYDGNAANGLVRLNADGSYDPTFAPTVQGGGPLTRDFNGMLVVGARYRLNEDGSTDPTFNAGAGFSNAYGPCTPFATVPSQGGILAVGDFTTFNGTGRNRMARVIGIPYSNITLPMRALLEGPYVSATTLMNDGLRTSGLIPATEPFTALGFTHVLEPPGPPVAASVFNPTFPVFNSIVDWVMVELRSASDPAHVLQTRSGLIQRDGDIVGTDGVSPLVFNQPLGNYYVALRHRNHAGCMTAAPIALSSTNAMLNFSLPPTTVTFGTQGQKAAGTRMVLWAGDATHDGTLKYTGSTNDRDPLLVAVGSSTPNATAPGYFPEDVNMDGTVKYTGSANDRDPILVNVGSTTPNNVRMEQLP